MVLPLYRVLIFASLLISLEPAIFLFDETTKTANKPPSITATERELKQIK